MLQYLLDNFTYKMGQLDTMAPDNFLLIMSYLFYSVNFRMWLSICLVSKRFNNCASAVISRIDKYDLVDIFKWCKPSAVEIMLCKKMVTPREIMVRVSAVGFWASGKIGENMKDLNYTSILLNAEEILNAMLDTFDNKNIVFILVEYRDIGSKHRDFYKRLSQSVSIYMDRGDHFVTGNGLRKLTRDRRVEIWGQGVEIWGILLVLLQATTIKKINKQQGIFGSCLLS